MTAKEVSVEIINGDVAWTPSFVYDGDYQVELFQVNEQELDQDHGCFSIRIMGLSTEDVEEVQDRFIMFHEEDPEVLFEAEGCEVLGNKQGSIYVGGVFIENHVSLSYGYNFKPEQIALTQDRSSVSSFDLHWLLSRLWKQYAPKNLLKAAIEKNLMEIQYHNNYLRTSVADELAGDFIEKHKGKVLVDSPEEVDKVESTGGKAVFLGNEGLTKEIKKSEEYQEYEESLGFEVEEELTPHEQVVEFIEYLKANMPIMPSEKEETLESLSDRLVEASVDWYV